MTESSIRHSNGSETNTKEALTIVKIGGNVIDNEEALQKVLDDFAAIKGSKILVHGGGKIADEMCAKLNIKPQKVDGRRITDADTLRVVTMVYGGLINKTLVAQLQMRGCNALGLTGADLNSIEAHKRINKKSSKTDYGFAGDVDKVKAKRLKSLLDLDFTLVFAPITHDRHGQLLNTNADTVASQLAIGLSEFFEVTLKFCFEKPGVLADPKNDDSVIPNISLHAFKQGKADGTITDGMIPKLDNAFDAMEHGVQHIFICGTEGVKMSRRRTKIFNGTSLTLT
jgi:acetylglutamate kinase